MKIGFCTDSASDIDFEYAKEHNIGVAPMNVYFHEQSYKEDPSLDFDQYYKNFETEKLFKVQTSQPAPGDFYEKYEELVAEGCDIIITATVSSGLSGTYNSAVQAGKRLEKAHEGVKVFVVDSLTASAGVQYLINLGLGMVKDGKTAEEIYEAMLARVKKIETYLCLPTLKYLRASGRVSMPKFLIGSLFGLKPLTYMNEKGENEAIGTARSMDKGIQKIYNLCTDNGTKLANVYTISHANDTEIAGKLEAIIREKQPDADVRKIRVRSSISAHTGPGALALIALFD